MKPDRINSQYDRIFWQEGEAEFLMRIVRCRRWDSYEIIIQGTWNRAVIPYYEGFCYAYLTDLFSYRQASDSIRLIKKDVLIKGIDGLMDSSRWHYPQSEGFRYRDWEDCL